MIAADGLASRPSASRAAMRRTCSISSHTPAAMKARQYPCTVCQGGYAAGRWRHWQPVRNTWISPSSTSRIWVVRGRPPGFGGGSIGDSSANSASLSRPPHPTSPTRCRVSGVQTIPRPHQSGSILDKNTNASSLDKNTNASSEMPKEPRTTASSVGRLSTRAGTRLTGQGSTAANPLRLNSDAAHSHRGTMAVPKTNNLLHTNCREDDRGHNPQMTESCRGLY
jgi:hypothetical protein